MHPHDSRLASHPHRSPRRRIRRFSLLTALAVLISLAGASVAARPSPTRAQGAGDASRLQQLAERLLGSRAPTPNGAAPPVQLLPGALPPDLPLDLPLPDGSVLIGSAVSASFARSSGGPFPLPGAASPSSPTGQSTDIVIDAPGAPISVLAFYQTALPALGWTPPRLNGQGPGGGFLPSFVPAYDASFCGGSEGPWLSVTVFPSSNGPNDLRLHVETGNSGPCSAPNGFAPPGPPPGADLLPPLHAPGDVQISSFGGSGGPGRFASDATATTAMTASDLETFYEQQLAAAGWTRVDGHDDGTLSWSTWSVPPGADPAVWQGFLLIRDGPVEGQRSLHVEVASSGPEASNAGVSVSTVSTATATATATAAPATLPAALPAPDASGG